MFADQRTHGVRAGIAEFRDQNKIKQIIMAIDTREKVDFLDEIEERITSSKKPETPWSLDYVRLNITADKP